MDIPFNAQTFSFSQTITDGAVHTQTGAPSSSWTINLADMLVTNSHATVGTVVNFIESSSGRVVYSGYAAPAGGGWSESLQALIELATGSDLQVQCVTSGANVIVSTSVVLGNGNRTRINNPVTDFFGQLVTDMLGDLITSP